MRRSSCFIFPGLIVVSVGALLAAWIGETFFHLKPCILCLYQRYAFWAVIGLSFLGLIRPHSRPWRKFFLILCGGTFLGGAGLALYQVLIEEAWIAAPASCRSVGFAPMSSFEDIRAQLLSQPYAPCDKVSWRLFGLSMAAYNAFFSFAMAVLCFFCLKRGRAHDNA